MTVSSTHTIKIACMNKALKETFSHDQTYGSIPMIILILKSSKTLSKLFSIKLTTLNYKRKKLSFNFSEVNHKSKVVKNIPNLSLDRKD